MQQTDALSAGWDQAGDAPENAASNGDDGAGTSASSHHDGRRRRYGRHRGGLPVGETFVSRLGPANGEPFAAMDDPPHAMEAARPTAATPIDDLTFVALDCETTGQSPHRLVELGAVAFTLERHILSFETLVHSNDRINPYARRLHGIARATLAGAPRAEEVLERFRGFVHGAVLVEHSADAFDTRLLARTMGEPLDADNLDTSRLAGRLWGLRDTIGLERLCAELGVAHRRPHHALADAEATAGCFVELVKRGREELGWRTLGDLLADGHPPPPRTSVPVAPRRRRAITALAEATGTPTDVPALPEDGARRRRRRGGRRRRRGPGQGGGEAPPAATPPAG